MERSRGKTRYFLMKRGVPEDLAGRHQSRASLATTSGKEARPVAEAARGGWGSARPEDALQLTGS